MYESGAALMAIGRGTGETRAADAARMAISSPLLDYSMEGARGVLLNITGGNDLALSEINEAAEIVQQAADPEANIIFGAVIDPRLENEVKITVIATGFELGQTRGGRRLEPSRWQVGQSSPSRGKDPSTGPEGAPESPFQFSDRQGPRDRDRDRTPTSEERDRPADRDRGPIRVGTIGGTQPESPPPPEEDLDVPPFWRKRR
jgi:hypothetical protein